MFDLVTVVSWMADLNRGDEHVERDFRVVKGTKDGSVSEVVGFEFAFDHCGLCLPVWLGGEVQAGGIVGHTRRLPTRWGPAARTLAALAGPPGAGSGILRTRVVRVALRGTGPQSARADREAPLGCQTEGLYRETEGVSRFPFPDRCRDHVETLRWKP